MKLLQIIAFLCLSLLAQSVRGGDLTPEQIESLRRQLTAVKENLDTHISTRNRSARSIFLEASQSARAAVSLYVACYKKVNYEMEGRSDSEYRAWLESEKEKAERRRSNNTGNLNYAERIASKQFGQSAMLALRYLALSCHAAEVKELDEVFGPLNAYVESLSHLDELPDRILTENVSSTVFAKAYELESLLGENESWEPVPFNIPGIYNKTILPHLRAESPQSILNAWDKRIEQEKRLVLFFEAKKKEALRGLGKDEKVQALHRQNQGGGRGIMQSHDLDDFNRETYPKLQWGRMKDMYKYVDQLEAAKAMLTFVQANLKSVNGEAFYADFMTVLSGAAE